MYRFLIVLSILAVVCVKLCLGLGYTSIIENQDTTKVATETNATNQRKPDKLILSNGQQQQVFVTNVTERFVYFTSTRDESLQYISSSDVDLIEYGDGRTLQVAEAISQKPKEKDWSDVKLTSNPDDVRGLIEIGKLEAKAIPPSNTHRYRTATLEANAEILMKRRAALVNADIVLVTHREVYIAYGDTPSVTLFGVAYRQR